MSYLLFRGLYVGVLSIGLAPEMRNVGFNFLADFRVPSIGGLRCTTGVEGVFSGTFNPFIRSANTLCGVDMKSIGDALSGDATLPSSNNRLYDSKSATRGSQGAFPTCSSTVGISLGWTQVRPSVQGQ
jgi:hypothetical protein